MNGTISTTPQRTIEEDFFEDEIGDMLLECGYGVIQRRCPMLIHLRD